KGPFIVAICGPSASGKTTIAKRLAQELKAGFLSTDFYYKHPEYVAKLPLYFDDIRSVDIDSLSADLKRWKMGLDITVPAHDPVSHKKLEPKHIPNTRVLIVEGIVSFHPKIAKFADLLVYIESSQQKRLKRRYRRDVNMRGREPSYVRDRFYSTVEEARLQYIEQQRHKAHMIILT
ncbi:MAG: (d)CMP kinase, partial [Candidatus Diapherotrites archaeon]